MYDADSSLKASIKFFILNLIRAREIGEYHWGVCDLFRPDSGRRWGGDAVSGREQLIQHRHVSALCLYEVHSCGGDREVRVVAANDVALGSQIPRRELEVIARKSEALFHVTE